MGPPAAGHRVHIEQYHAQTLIIDLEVLMVALKSIWLSIWNTDDLVQLQAPCCLFRAFIELSPGTP